VKQKTHPNYHEEAKVRCACGNEFVVGSTLPELRVDICSSCHPFFTGKQKFVDAAGRVDKYFRKYGDEAQKKYKKKKKRKLTSEEESELASAKEIDINNFEAEDTATEPVEEQSTGAVEETKIADAAPAESDTAPAETAEEQDTGVDDDTAAADTSEDAPQEQTKED